MVGGAHNQIPYLFHFAAQTETNYIPEVIPGIKSQTQLKQMRVYSIEVRVLSPTSGSLAEGLAIGTGAPRAFGFEGQQGLCAGPPQD